MEFVERRAHHDAKAQAVAAQKVADGDDLRAHAARRCFRERFVQWVQLGWNAALVDGVKQPEWGHCLRSAKVLERRMFQFGDVGRVSCFLACVCGERETYAGLVPGEVIVWRNVLDASDLRSVWQGWGEV